MPKEVVETLPKLGKGEFCFVGDWVNGVSSVKVGSVKTPHLGFMPEVIPPSPEELQTVIEALQEKLPDLISSVKNRNLCLIHAEAGFVNSAYYFD